MGAKFFVEFQGNPFFVLVDTGLEFLQEGEFLGVIILFSSLFVLFIFAVFSILANIVWPIFLVLGNVNERLLSIIVSAIVTILTITTYVIKFLRIQTELQESEIIELVQFNENHRIRVLLQRYVHTQLLDVRDQFSQDNLPSLTPKQLIQQEVKENFAQFINYIGRKVQILTQYQQQLAWRQCLEIASPVMEELDVMYKQRYGDDQIRQKYEEEQKKRVQDITQENLLFGEVLTPEEELPPLVSPKPVSILIDDLLDKYNDWDQDGKTKKDTS